MEIKTTDIVVASHKETLRWVEMWKAFNKVTPILPGCKFKIYRTGDPMEGATMLVNKGREAGQWLAHIVENYDKLADVTLFVQADLGASFGQNPNEWPQDLNVFKRMRLPVVDGGGCCELGPIDDYSYYGWPSLSRVRVSVTTPGFGEKHNRGFGPNLAASPADPEIKLLWGEKTPSLINWSAGGMEFGAQHMLTRGFIRRLPKEYYSNILDAVRNYELAHWLEFGKWPVIIYDVFRQGPLRDPSPTKA
jgi:hypothetical protein